MSRTLLRSGSLRFLPATVGAGALLGGFLLLQFGYVSSSADASSTPQLAVATRGTDQAASRGSSRTPAFSGVSNSAKAEAEGLVASPLELSQFVPTTTIPPTTTVPPTTPPKPKPTTTTTKAKLKEKPPVEARPAGPTGDDVWVRLAKCESGMRNDPGAPYYGYFQFTASTWRGIGGSDLPTDHPYEEQLAMAKKLQARSGWGQWPVCSKVALRG